MRHLPLLMPLFFVAVVALVIVGAVPALIGVFGGVVLLAVERWIGSGSQ